MTQDSSTKTPRERESQARSTTGRTIPDKRGCGPDVDTWPILDKQGRPIPDNEDQRSRP